MKRYVITLLLLAVGTLAQAREVFPLNEGWRFFFKSETTSDNARHVTLPHSWNTDPMTEGDFLETTGNYLNDIFIPAEWASKRLFVKFNGAQSVADLFVNGCHVGQHRGGGTAFTFEITDKVRFGADNALLMVVSNSARQDVLPTSTDMNLYGGLYREAEMIVTNKTAISPLYLGTDGVLVRTHNATAAAAGGEVEVHLTAKGEGQVVLRLDITAPDGQCAFTKQLKVRLDGKAVMIPFVVENPALWSPSQPALYTVTATLGEGTATDQVRVRTGFRTLAVQPGKSMTINGQRVPVRGVSLYHDNAVAGGTLSARDYDDDLRQIADLGATALRSAVMPHAQYLYDRCDERGLLVWIDLPLHRAFLSDVAYFSTPLFEKNGMDQLQEMIAQNINHPSVVIWGLFSRLWMRGDDVTPYLRRLNDAAHKLDPSRPTAACSDQNGAINFITDLIVWAQDVGWSRGKTEDLVVWRNQMLKSWSHLRSGVCYGGSGIIGHKSYTAQAAPRANWMPVERQSRFHEEYAKVLHSDSIFWGVWVNNMFDYGSARRPYGVNCDGLVTLNRRECKDAYYLYRALWNTASPTLYIADKAHALRDQEKQTFRVYSSAGAPRMTIGRDSVAMKEYAPCQYRSDTVTVRGLNVVRVSAGTLSDSLKVLVGNVLKPKRSEGLRRTISPQTTN